MNFLLRCVILRVTADINPCCNRKNQRLFAEVTVLRKRFRLLDCKKLQFCVDGSVFLFPEKPSARPRCGTAFAIWGIYCYFADKDAAVIAARNRQRCGREQAFISTAFANLEMPLASAEALRETAVQRERFLEYGRLFAPKTPEKEKTRKNKAKNAENKPKKYCKTA